MKAALCLLAVAVCSVAAGCSKHDESKCNLAMFLQNPPGGHTNAIEYRCQPPDLLVIKSAHIMEINDVKQTVRPDGRINLPLVGEINAAGRTPREIEDDILQVAKKYYSTADVMVQVEGYASQKYYVFGEVTTPGPMVYTGRDSLLDAIGKCQPTRLCQPEKVVVLRGQCPQCGGFQAPRTKEEIAKYQKHCKDHGCNECGAQVLEVDCAKMCQSGDLSHNIMIKPNDVIYVPAHPMVEAGYGISRWIYPTRPVLEGVRTPVAISGTVAGAGTTGGGGY